ARSTHAGAGRRPGPGRHTGVARALAFGGRATCCGGLFRATAPPISRFSPLQEETMRALLIAGVAAAVVFGAEALAQGTGGSTGGGTAATGNAGRGTSPSTTPVPIQPQRPSTGQTNPGVSPSVPGPSSARTPPGIASPAPQQPGFGSSHRQPRAEDVPQPDTNSDDAIKALDKDINRKLSICRGC